VVYGAGGCGRQVRAILAEHGFEVAAFLDRNGRGDCVDGVLCLSPDDERAARLRQSGATVVVGVWNYTADGSEIEQILAMQGWARVAGFPDFYELFAPHAGDRFWLAPRALYRENATRAAILAAARLWRDETSRDLFARAIETRLSGELFPVNEPLRVNEQTQYFPADIPRWPAARRFVDCGAFDGDTLRALPEPPQAVAAFEPDARNFDALAAWARAERQSTPQRSVPLLLWPCGVWSETTQLRFTSEGAASRSAAGGESIVPVVALDDALTGFAPDFIKMDIEGAEPAALQGARRLITAHRPALAICVYHHAAHLWQIPLELHSWQLGYELFLRAHGYNGFDWVLYARPAND
jgi:FkbM family methyltransferase